MSQGLMKSSIALTKTPHTTGGYRGCQSGAEQDRGREGLHDCDHADQKVDEEQRENARSIIASRHRHAFFRRSVVGVQLTWSREA